MSDPYKIIGVARSATEAEIKSAYRKLAKKLHPDMNPGRKDIEQKFKEVTAAYDLLSDKTKRAKFDRGEIDENGNERGFHHAGGDPYGGMGGGYSRRGKSSGPFGFGGGAGVNAEDLFAEFFGGAKQRHSAYREQEPLAQDVTYTITVPFVEACVGGKKRVILDNKKTIDINIPPGTEDGHKLRLRGLGRNGGAALIEINIEPHESFRREGQDIHLDVPIALHEALLGASITVPTLTGKVSLKVSPGSNTGTLMRLKGKGVPSAKGATGDMFVTLRVLLPDTISPDLSTFVEKWAKKHAYNPRKKMNWG
ncbi:MAG: DnaJ C-terminal domain-containing protein [Alphaproteobacteria bacterium]|nr:DnaJ C-terminal domain-containing protein [Alphaproteobacteria bacterium]